MTMTSDGIWSLVGPRLRLFLGQTWNFDFVAEATGSTVPTVSNWLANQVPPAERIIKLWHLLAAVGYDSPEIDELPVFNRYCGELLAFGVVGFDELKDFCGVTDANAVLRMLRGTMPQRPQFTPEELSELYERELRKRKADAPRVDVLVSTETPEAELISQPSAQAADTIGNVGLVVSTASALSSVLPLVRYFDSDDCMSVERSRLRALVGNDGMFELSNHLNNLCSERARSQGRSGHQR